MLHHRIDVGATHEFVSMQERIEAAGRIPMDAMKTVLVVDDDPSITAFLEMALEDAGYQVLAAVGGAALQIAHDRHPDVILLDIMMPEMDGVEVSQHLHTDPVTADIPIIAMSAHERLRTLASRMSAEDELPKPFHCQDLYATVARWMPSA
jgi:two-component system, sensor histidine kinase and response regulator